METVVTETVFVYEQSRMPLSDLGCEIESTFTVSDSETTETIATEDVAESVITNADNVHPSINGQHKVRKKSLDTEDEYLGHCESEESRDKDKPGRPNEPVLFAKGDPSYMKGSPESEEKLWQTSSVKSDIECSPKKLACLGVTDKCQDTKDISNNYVEVPPVNDSSITKLDKVLESQFSRQNEGVNNKKCEEDNRQKYEEKIHDSKKTDKEHYRKKRQYSDSKDQKQSRSKADDRSYKRRRSRSMETNKQYHHKQDYCNKGKYRPSYNERNSPNNGKSSGKYSRYKSRSRERTEQDRNRYYHSKGERTWNRERYYQDELRRWEKCRYYKDYYSVHGTGDGRERKSSHFDKAFDKLSQFYKSHRDYHCKSRWAHNTHSREEGAHHLSSHRENFRHCSLPLQQSEKHSREGHAPPPASAHAQFDNSFWENEKLRLGKKKYGDAEGSEAEVEKKRRKIDDQRMKKDKKVKKKKKSKDKYREKDYKLQDLDGLVFRIDNDNRKRKKKKKKKKHIRKLKDFSEYLDSRLEKTTQEKKRVPIFSGNYLCEQYRGQGSEKTYKDRKPSGAGDNKKYGFIPSSKYVNGELFQMKNVVFVLCSVPAPQRSEGDRLMETVVTENNNYAEVPPVNDSSLTKLDKVLESQFSRQNEGLNNKKCEEDNGQKYEEKIHDSKKTDKEHCRKKRQYSDIDEEKQSRSKVDDCSCKRRCSHRMETNKQYHPKQDYCNEDPEAEKERNKTGISIIIPKEREPGAWRWEKCRYYKPYDSVHRKGDGRERKSSHFDKAFDKLSQFYKSHRHYHCKSRWAHNTHCREEGWHHLSSHSGNFRHCSLPLQQSEKHSREGHAPPPASAHAQFDNSFWENEKLRLGKRKYGNAEGREGEVEKKCRKIDDKYQVKDYKQAGIPA
ncbi:ubiquitin carboxyl-terminal hydrolase 42-like [Pezoporus flaviventris]|uniref:ubiquitin carboxyl-terminal hydrolase 42-like n=1 Tax=Pezoporus flaviventris TaxID=889875 RepID=UPI002AB1BD6A|nr:ubiquitin carboxyl-terminal hydrolase 42-like [Pezoporus flaviventris]